MHPVPQTLHIHQEVLGSNKAYWQGNTASSQDSTLAVGGESEMGVDRNKCLCTCRQGGAGGNGLLLRYETTAFFIFSWVMGFEKVL